MSAFLLIVEKPAGSRIYFGQLSPSYHSLRHLHEKKFKTLGTIREGRTMKCLLQSSKTVEKEKRGFFDYCSNDYVFILLLAGFAGVAR